MKRSRAQIQESKISTWTNHDDNEDKLFNFVPPLHIQRKRVVLDVVMDYAKTNYPEKTPIVPNFKIIDVGCERGAFFQFLQTELIGIKNKFNTNYIGIDISEFTLTNDTVENLRKFSMGNSSDLRSGSVSVMLLNENVLYPSIPLDRPDVLVMIEVIEHIKPAEVDELLPHSIFGVICPNRAIITTPNADFNIVFGMKSRLQFRHWDHKFEWTRKEFRAWCDKVVNLYPHYEFVIKDIGTSSAHPTLGGGSQMAIFNRIYLQPNTISDELVTESKVVYRKDNLFLALSEADVIKKYLSYQMSMWATARQVLIFDENEADNSLDDSMTDNEYTSSENGSCNLGRVDFNEETGSEQFSVSVAVVERVIRKVYPGARDIDVPRMLEECCLDSIYFEFDQEKQQIVYELERVEEEDEDEEAYITRISMYSNVQSLCDDFQDVDICEGDTR